MATLKQGSSQDLLRTLTSYLGFPTLETSRALQTLLTQRREVLSNPLAKKVRYFEGRNPANWPLVSDPLGERS